MFNILKNVLVVINDLITELYIDRKYKFPNIDYSIGTYIDIDGQILKTNINGNNIYFFNSKNQRHRLDGPAIQYPDGSYYWYKEGEIHRIGGPAVFDEVDYYDWWVNDKQVKVYYICG